MVNLREICVPKYVLIAVNNLLEVRRAIIGPQKYLPKGQYGHSSATGGLKTIQGSSSAPKSICGGLSYKDNDGP